MFLGTNQATGTTTSNYAIPGYDSTGFDPRLAASTLGGTLGQIPQSVADVTQGLATAPMKAMEMIGLADPLYEIPGAPVTGYDPRTGKPMYQGDPYDINSPAGQARLAAIRQQYQGR